MQFLRAAKIDFLSVLFSKTVSKRHRFLAGILQFPLAFFITYYLLPRY